jgi:hypothetical protein
VASASHYPAVRRGYRFGHCDGGAMSGNALALKLCDFSMRRRRMGFRRVRRM